MWPIRLAKRGAAWAYVLVNAGAALVALLLIDRFKWDFGQTGSSLRKNGLRILDTLLTSYTELVANREAYEDPRKRAAMEDIALLLQGAIRARGKVLLKLNVSDARLQAVLDIMPSMSSPTVTPLAGGEMPKRGVNTLIPALKAAGAFDILEIPITKIVD